MRHAEDLEVKRKTELHFLLLKMNDYRTLYFTPSPYLSIKKIEQDYKSYEIGQK
jgi:hypothetical protein